MRRIVFRNKGLAIALLSSVSLTGLLFYPQNTTWTKTESALLDSDEDSSLPSRLNNIFIDFIAEHLKQNKEQSLLQNGLSEQELIARLLNESASLDIRKLDAWRLAVLGTPNARLALLSLLENGSDAMRAIVAEMLGHGRWADIPELLAPLFQEHNLKISRGAVSGLILHGGAKSMEILRDLLLNETTDEAIKRYTAYRLGNVQTAAALETLKTAISMPSLSEETFRHIAVSLGKFPFQQTSGIFRQIMDNPRLSSELKTDAAESLIQAGKASLPFLREISAANADPEVRASAAWAAGAHPNTGHLGRQFADLLQSEAHDDVRRRLYESMMRQTDIPADTLLDRALTETKTATRVAAANMLAMALQQPGTGAAVQHRYDQKIVPQLLATALSDESINLRYRAVFALTRAGTETAAAALRTIEQQGDPQISGLAGRKIALLTH